MDSSIQHRKIIIAPQQEALPAPQPALVHRYRTSRPWSVAVLAVAAAGGAVLLTGGLSSALDNTTSSAGAPALQSEGYAAARIVPRTAPPAPAPMPKLASASGPWQIQIGAFSSPDAAQAQLRAAETQVPELASLTGTTQPWGEVTRARFGGIGDEAAADRLCGQVIAAGAQCFVVSSGG